ncbi:MAG: lanthionine synthetase C family protein [Parachlamydiaceae bacterium]|nr:lanthionine synthetase C family protein [Parachlamydiaceae bacterium]
MYHVFDICQDIAEKLKNPSVILAQAEQESIAGLVQTFAWPLTTFAGGFPGIACFFASMDHVFPDQGWSQVTHEYLKLTVNFLENGGDGGYSLFGGLSGLCFAIHICSKNGSRYQGVLSKLEAILEEKIGFELSRIAANESTNESYVPAYQYSLMNGIPGAAAYLLLRKDNSRLKKLAKDCIDILVKLLMKSRKVGDVTVPGWYAANEAEQNQYPGGSYILSTTYGVVGCLSVLGLAAWDGIEVPRIHESIKMVSQWLIENRTKVPSGFDWPVEIPFEDVVIYPENFVGSLVYGNPAVNFSLYLAGRALGDKAQMNLAETSFVNYFTHQDNRWKEKEASLMHGGAGLLALVNRMQKLTYSVSLKQIASTIEQSIKNEYRPNHRYGFQTYKMTDKEKVALDDPGFLNGASGIGLALLSSTGRLDDILWDRAFLLA